MTTFRSSAPLHVDVPCSIPHLQAADMEGVQGEQIPDRILLSPTPSTMLMLLSHGPWGELPFMQKDICTAAS